jgi:hypothetical protein
MKKIFIFILPLLIILSCKLLDTSGESDNSNIGYPTTLYPLTETKLNELQTELDSLSGYQYKASLDKYGLIGPAGLLSRGSSSINDINSAASAAIFTESLSTPDALVLVSPAVSLQKDDWFKKILLNRVDIDSVSPDKNVREGLPPTIILQGRDDTVTPLAGVQNFADRMVAAGNYCELIIYDGVGHLFTPSSEPDDGWPNPDPKIEEKAFGKVNEFLRKFGYIK